MIIFSGFVFNGYLCAMRISNDPVSASSVGKKPGGYKPTAALAERRRYCRASLRTCCDAVVPVQHGGALIGRNRSFGSDLREVQAGCHGPPYPYAVDFPDSRRTRHTFRGTRSRLVIGSALTSRRWGIVPAAPVDNIRDWSHPQTGLTRLATELTVDRS